MKISIIGSHGTGKSTLCEAFIKTHPDYIYIKELARYVNIEKIPLNKRDETFQRTLMYFQKWHEEQHDNFISDRSLLDYAIYSNSKKLINECAPLLSYDLIVFIPIRFAVEYDNFRNTDEVFREEIEARFIKYMPKNVYFLKSITIKDRIEELEKVINELQIERKIK